MGVEAKCGDRDQGAELQPLLSDVRPLGLTVAPPHAVPLAAKTRQKLLLNPMKKKETLNFRVSAEFKRRLIEEAERERRSLTNYLEATLTKLWDERGLPTAKKRETSKN